jgi:acetyltransferase
MSNARKSASGVSLAAIGKSTVDYPSEWERSARTLDGIGYHIRPIRSDDQRLEREFIVGLSPESHYERMMCARHEPSPELIDRFINVDYERDMAFVAVTGMPADEHIVGVARYCADPNLSDCEFAVAVADEWQARGVGGMLTRMLFDYARTKGVHKLHGDVLASNLRMLELVHWLGMKTSICPHETELVEASREL